MPEKLTWECVDCRTPVQDQMGTLSIDISAVDLYEGAIQQWHAEHGDSVTASQLSQIPSKPRWRVHHDECFMPGDGSYFIPVESVRTAPQLLEWTAHLWEKVWFPSTRWDLTIREVL